MKKIVIFAVFMGFVLLGSPAIALDEAAISYDNATQASLPMPAAERFGRGMINIISSPLEMPAQMYVRSLYMEETQNNYFATAGALIEGVVIGTVVYFPWRLWAGVFDLGTLWWDGADRAIIDPEYLSFSTDRLKRKTVDP